MEEIFTKLCSLVNVERRMEERIKEKEEEERKKKLLLAAKSKLMKEESNAGMRLMSSKLMNRNKRTADSKKKPKPSMKTEISQKIQKSKSATHLKLPLKEEDPCPGESPSPASDRSGRMSLDSGVSLESPGLSLAWEAKDPDRDCSHFDPAERARELFEALDVNGDGAVSEEEFISGCLKDEVFVMMLEQFSGENIWGL